MLFCLFVNDDFAYFYVFFDDIIGVNDQVRENLRKAIAQSGLVVKEIADRSNVKKATIDNWVGNRPTTPRVNDLVEVAKVLGVTAEWIVTGISPEYWYPPYIAGIVEELKTIKDDSALESIRVVVHSFAEKAKEQEKLSLEDNQERA